MNSTASQSGRCAVGTSRSISYTAPSMTAVLGRDGIYPRGRFRPKFPPSRLADAFDQVVEPLITEIT